MLPGVTVLNQIHRKSQNVDVNARESSGGEKRATMCVRRENVCAYQTDFVSVWLSFDV